MKLDVMALSVDANRIATYRRIGSVSCDEGDEIKVEGIAPDDLPDRVWARDEERFVQRNEGVDFLCALAEFGGGVGVYYALPENT